MKKKCKHYFKWGYDLNFCVFCKKCGRNLEDIVGESEVLTILRWFDLKNGKFVLKDEYNTKKSKE